MTERALWHSLRAADVFDFAMRVESPSTPGCPDVYYNIEGSSGWLELKSISGSPGPRAHPLAYRIQPNQVMWHTRAAAQGVRAFFLVLIDKNAVLLPGAYVKVLLTASVSDIFRHAIWRGGSDRRTRFAGLRHILILTETGETDAAFSVAASGRYGSS